MHHCATPHGRQRTERSMPRYLPKQISVFFGLPFSKTTFCGTVRHAHAVQIDHRRHLFPRAYISGQKRSDPAKADVPERCFAITPQGRRPSSCANEVAKIVIMRLFRTRALRTKTGFRRQRHGYCCARAATRTCCGDFTVRLRPKCQRTRDNLSPGYMTDA